MLTLCRATYDGLLAHLRAEWPREGCGLLGGVAGRACRHIPVTNVARRADRFRMAPDEQVAALYALEAAGEQLLGIYHSHPHGPAWPSPRDRADAAFPDVAYLVVSLAAPEAPVVGVFRLDGERFARLAWEVE